MNTPPGIYVDVPAGVHTQVELPGGEIHPLNPPITMAKAGRIFIPVQISPETPWTPPIPAT